MIQWHRCGFRNSYEATIGGNTYRIDGNISGLWDAMIHRDVSGRMVGLDPTGYITQFSGRRIAAIACAKHAGLQHEAHYFKG